MTGLTARDVLDAAGLFVFLVSAWILTDVFEVLLT